MGGNTAFHRQGTRLLLQFEEFSLDLRRRELRRDGDLLTLEPKVFDLLVFLVENRDRVVTRDELITHVWNGRIVSESALATCINASRSALNDSGEQQRLIKTLPRKGIRFVGDVRQQVAPAAELPHEAEPPALPDCLGFSSGNPCFSIRSRWAAIPPFTVRGPGCFCSLKSSRSICAGASYAVKEIC